jgi:hypothetical protein
MDEKAQALCKLALVRGGFRLTQLSLAIHEAHNGDKLVGVATVISALQDLYEERRAEIEEFDGDGDAERDEAIAYYRKFVEERGDTLGA